MTNQEKSIRVKADTHTRVKVAAAKAGLTHDEIVKYALNLIAAYPPTQDYKWAQEQKEAANEH